MIEATSSTAAFDFSLSNILSVDPAPNMYLSAMYNKKEIKYFNLSILWPLLWSRQLRLKNENCYTFRFHENLTVNFKTQLTNRKCHVRRNKCDAFAL